MYSATAFLGVEFFPARKEMNDVMMVPSPDLYNLNSYISPPTQAKLILLNKVLNS